MSASSLRQRGSLAALVACALVATACGGGSSSGAAATSSGAAVTTTGGAAATSAAGTTTTAAPSAAGTTTAAPTTTDAPAPTTTKVVAKGGGTFCKDIATILNGTGAGGAVGTDQQKVKALVQKGLAEAATLANEAPSEIKTDVATLAGAVVDLYTALQKANYDFTKVDPSTLTTLNTPAVKAAETKVDAYVKVKCGIDVPGAASS